MGHLAAINNFGDFCMGRLDWDLEIEGNGFFLPNSPIVFEAF